MKGYARTHAEAECHECDWDAPFADKVAEAARRHHIATGHEISIDLGFTKVFRAKATGKE